MYNERILPWFKENVADALFLKKQANVRWISGFKGADTCVMVTANGGFLITDPRYTEQAEIEAPDFTLVNRQRDKSLGFYRKRKQYQIARL